MKTRSGYLINRNGTYYACWTIRGKKFMRTTRESNERKARQQLKTIMEPYLLEDDVRILKQVASRIDESQSGIEKIENDRNPPPPMSAVWAKYLTATNRPDSGPMTLTQYEGHFEQFTKWVGKTQSSVASLRDVTEQIASEYAAHLMARGLSANRFNKHVRFLELMFRVLKKPARLDRNPWENIQRKRQVPHSRRELTMDELRRVCQSAIGDFRVLFAIGIYSGLRLGDCATLQWSEVDLGRNRIRRIPNKTARRNPKPVLIPIHPILRALLEETPVDARRAFVLPAIAELYQTNAPELCKKLQDHFRANGIETQGVAKEKRRRTIDVGFHSLRHTFVSLCREADAPLAVVEAIVGHSNPAMTRHYTHVSEQAAVKAIAGLPMITGAGEQTTVPVVRTIPVSDILPLAERLDATNWNEVRAALLEKLAAA